MPPFPVNAFKKTGNVATSVFMPFAFPQFFLVEADSTYQLHIIMNHVPNDFFASCVPRITPNGLISFNFDIIFWLQAWYQFRTSNSMDSYVVNLFAVSLTSAKAVGKILSKKYLTDRDSHFQFINFSVIFSFSSMLVDLEIISLIASILS